MAAGHAIAPQNPVILNNLGMCQMLNNEYGPALKCFMEATKLAPANARYQANMAVALGMLGEYDLALDVYKNTVPAAEAHYNLAVLCEARKDSQRAEQEFRRAANLGLKLPD